MEKLELTPVELMSVLGWKKSKVYYWINSGKFETVSKMGIQKVVISSEDIEDLKKSKDLKQFENFENSSENFENVQINSNPNVTKDYKKVSNSLNSDALEFFNKSLETIERINQNALNNFGFTTKLLTDGHSALENEIYELKAEKKTVEENLKKFEKKDNIKNIIIVLLAFLLALSLLGFIFVSNTPKNSQTVQIDGLKSSILDFVEK